MTKEREPEKKPAAPEGAEAEKPFHLEVSAGDRVRITAEALVDPEAQIATPIKLFKLIGWPNDFLVLDVYDDEKHGQVLVLDPCCNWIKDPEKHQKHQCVAHSSRLFEVVERAPTTAANRRYSGVNIAGLDILSVEYLNGGENPALAVRVAGRKPIILNGQPAHILSQFLRAQKVF
jgi:hypothetical protein